jgi:hypothetical protein
VTVARADLATGLPGLVAELLDALHGAGLQAATDLADLEPPGVLLGSPDIGFRFGRCHDATFTAWVIVPALDRTQAIGQLAGLLETVAGVLAPLGAVFSEASADEIAQPTGGLLPAYAFSFTRRIR